MRELKTVICGKAVLHEITNTFKGKAHGDMPDIIKAVGLTKKYERNNP